jgi:hypothetical protein
LITAIVSLTREVAVGALQVVGQKEKHQTKQTPNEEDLLREDVQMYE